MKFSRERTDILFRIHAFSLGITKLEKLPEPFHYRVTLTGGEELRALILSCSWDYWEYRLKLAAPALDLIVCSEHDSCVPVRTMELGSSGYTYAARELPHSYRPGAKRTKKTALIFLGALLSGDQEAFDLLKQLPPSTRKRYQHRLKGLLTEKPIGHPLTVAHEFKVLAQEEDLARAG